MRRDARIIALHPKKGYFFIIYIAIELENLPGLIVLNYALMRMYQLPTCSYLACYCKDILNYIYLEQFPLHASPSENIL